jgi:hypothetical protein
MQRIATCRHFNIRERRRSPATVAAHSAERAERKRRGTGRTSAAARRLETGGAPKPPAPAESPPPAKSPTAKVTGKVGVMDGRRTHTPYAKPSAPSPSPAPVKSPAPKEPPVAQRTCPLCDRHLVPSAASQTPFVNGTCDGREHAGAMQFAPGDTIHLCPTALVRPKAHCNFAVCAACHSPGGPHSPPVPSFATGAPPPSSSGAPTAAAILTSAIALRNPTPMQHQSFGAVGCGESVGRIRIVRSHVPDQSNAGIIS